MKKPLKYILIVSISLSLVSVAAGYFLTRTPREALLIRQLHQEMGDLLSDRESELLKAFARELNGDHPQQKTAIIVENKFEFRAIFHKLLRGGLQLRYHHKTDVAEKLLGIAGEIAGIYEKDLDDSFLTREFEFCNALTGDSLTKKVQLDSLYQKGQGSLANTDYSTAQQYYEKSLNLCREIGDRRCEVDNLLKIQYILYKKVLNDRALQLGHELLPLVRQIGYRYREGWILKCLGSIYIELGDYRKARENFEAGLLIAEQLADRRGQMHLTWRMGLAFLLSGEYPNALRLFDAAIKLCYDFDNHSPLSKIYSDRALVYKKIGDYSKAEKDLQRSLALAEENRDEEKIALALMNLGELYRILGVYERALDYLFRAAKFCNKLGIFYDEALTFTIIGDVYRDRGKHEQALTEYQRSLKTIRHGEELGEKKSNRLESEILLSMGDVLMVKGDLAAAGESYYKALRYFKALEFPEGIVHALIRIANLLRESGNFPAALDSLNTARELSAKLQYPLLESNTFYSSGLVYKDLENFPSAAAAFSDAIDIVESTRKKISGELKINYFATVQDFYDEMILLQYEQAAYARAFEYSERSRARAFLDLFQAGVHPFIYDNDQRRFPAAIDNIRNSVANELQFVEYKVLGNMLLIFTVEKDTLRVIKSPVSRQALSEWVFEFRKAIGADDYQAFEDRLAMNPDSVEAYFQTLSQRLYSLTIEPIKGYLSSEKVLYIIADEVLHYLPFAALLSSGDDSAKFLIEEFNVAYAPSAVILKHCLEQRKPPLAPDQMKLLGVGNPTLDLPYAEQEVRKIAQIFATVDTLIGINAAEDKVERLLHRENGYNILHFATHAIIDEKSPLYSYLELGLPNDVRQEQPDPRSSIMKNGSDNQLMAHEVFELDLSQAYLVTLSACETAGGRLFRGEGIVGMIRSFMKAGASSILTTLWDIDDRYTEKIMTSFYEHWVHRNMTKAEALRAAQLEILQELRLDGAADFPHPHRWASFTLTGDYR